MISVENALKLVKEQVQPLSRRLEVSLNDAFGRYLSEDVLSKINMPPFPQSAMDGYAVHFSEEIDRYELIGEIAAGSDFHPSLKLGQAVRIFTGGAVPESATTVVRQEDVLVEDGWISFTAGVKQNMNIRPKAEQIAVGEIALRKGSYLDAAAIGYLGMLGHEKVAVTDAPKVAILTTGDELVKPGQALAYGQVYESNSIMLEQAFRSKSIHQIQHVKLPDDYDQTVAAIEKVLNDCDLIVLSGGISVGDYDYVKSGLEANGVEEVFYKVKQKPGKPLFFGTKNQKCIFALPGNPAAALTAFYVYLFPALQQMQGGQFEGCTRIQLPIASDYSRKAKRAEFLKGKIENNEVAVLSAQSSAMLSSFTQADGLIYIPFETLELKKGDEVEVLLL
jgi:molybdopterin molybdotransferase